MYKLLSIQESLMTRDILLENLETKTLDKCFDDSALISDDNNFEFMNIGGTYDCKLQLFGIIAVKGDTDRVVLCKVIEKDILIGIKEYVKVLVDKDVYYLNKKDICDVLDRKDILFKVSRKDIIQVNDVIHDDLIR